MNFLSMKYFTTIAQEKSFTKAASKLHITQQTLSAHISAIEKEIGSQLILRHVPLELTYAGQIFLKYASYIQGKYENMHHEFKDMHQDNKGKIRVGITHTRGRVVMPKLITIFQKKYPKIEIEIIENSNDLLCQSLLNNEVDLIIGNFDKLMPEILLEDFYGEEIVLAIAKKLLNALYKKDKKNVIKKLEKNDISILEKCPFLLNTYQDLSGRIGHGILSQGNFIPNIVTTSSNIETLLNLCVYGMGACFCPENLIKKVLNQEQLSSLNVFKLGKEARYRIQLGYLKKPYQWKILTNFIDIAKKNYS
ncbi:LysR family transcriptional regulator [Fusobacterium sp. PH5-44]|uniref:LysR family transcriptional regulator n=1 Tax=unclassified Fusobacterium TaxID=2648384 RepID=UPI003D1F49FB